MIISKYLNTQNFLEAERLGVTPPILSRISIYIFAKLKKNTFEN
jgi:hypothetical protein